jgi:vancomycin resistance protein YoaR
MITTKQISVQVGKSTQAVRDKAKELGIEKRIEGKTQVFSEDEAAEIVAKFPTSSFAPALQSLQQEMQSTLQSEKLAILEEMNELLKKQVESQSKRIDELQSEVFEERSHSREKTDQLAELADKLATMANNAQLLHGESRGLLPSSHGEASKLSRWKRLIAAWKGD